MKRLTVWIDCAEGEVEEVTRKVEAFLQKTGVEYTILRAPSDIAKEKRSR